MAKIVQLDQNTINKIAAGEVIERPSAVVKELVENAIDAKASAITIEVKDGGISMIRITDNGSGIQKDDIKAAFLPHATSKISSVEDLFMVKSLGFRGEALASIASVAQVELITKTPSDLLGQKYVIEGGEEKLSESIGCPEGTTFIVRNLFYNTPVRRKFLKSASTEAGYVSELVERLAISNPNISFKFINNGKIKVHTSGNGNLKDIIYGIFGREISSNLKEVNVSKESMSVCGFVGKPIISRGNRNYENYYINGRYIKSNIINKAIEEAFKPYMMQHRYPFTSLHITIKNSLVDVNVHPTKMEIRFVNEAEIYDFIYHAISNALKEGELIPSVELFKRKEEKSRINKEFASAEPFEKIRREKIARVAQNNSNYNVKPGDIAKLTNNVSVEYVKNSNESVDIAAFNKDNISLGDNKSKGTDSNTLINGNDVKESDNGAKESDNNTSANDNDAKESDNNTFVNDNNSKDTDNNASATGTTDISLRSIKPLKVDKSVRKESISTTTKDINMDNVIKDELSDRASEEQTTYIDINSKNNINSKEIDKLDEKAEQLSLFDSNNVKDELFKGLRIVGQVFLTYWIVEYDKKMYIIDQHAAHEKVMYERIMTNLRNSTHNSQMITPPVIVTLSMNEEEKLNEYMQVFTRLGFEIEHFGGRDYSISAVPADMFGIANRDLFIELLDSLSETDNLEPEIVLEKTATMACKSAVKGNSKMSFMEAETLIKEMMTLENPFNCPHGRPTTISISKQEMEKKFKRIL